jgi:nucleoside 2-deoxyribosyltransferase
MKRQTRADELVDPKIDSDYPLVYAHDANEFRYFLEALRDQGLLKMPEVAKGRSLGRVMLTPSGWQQALELQKNQRNSDQAFMAMWFAEELNEAWENGFKPALQEVGFHPYRADQDEHNDKIDDRIVSEIRRSGLLVADFTGHRGGVYFEAGFAFGLGIPVIWTCRESDIATAHFDTRQYNHVVWSTPEEIKSKLILRINATIPARIIRSG